jgi:hypothetical protein
MARLGPNPLPTKVQNPMPDIPEYKLEIFTDALIALETEASVTDVVDDEFSFVAEDIVDRFDESGADIAADLIEIQTGFRNGRRAKSQRKYVQSDRGKAIVAAAQKIWRQSDAGKAAAAARRQSAAGQAARQA